jgi:thioesterase domain-containing protein
VASVWCELLGLQRVGRLDHFFELGGHSLLAVAMVSRLSSRLELNIPLDSLFSDATLCGFAAAIAARSDGETLLRHVRGHRAAGSEPAYAPLMELQTGAAEAIPLFCVPGAGASVTSFHALARALGPDVPVLGFQPRGLEGSLAPHADVESAARSYIEALQQLRPSGPYHLVGHSFGGWVVFEMARQLALAGEEIGLLVVLDAEAPLDGKQEHQVQSRGEVMWRLVKVFQSALGQSLGIQEGEWLALDSQRQFTLLLERLVQAHVLVPPSAARVLHGMVRVFEANLNTAYRPVGLYLQRMYVVAAQEAKEGSDRLLTLISRWRRHAPQASAWQCPGHHFSLLTQPHVSAVADWMRPLLMAGRVADLA